MAYSRYATEMKDGDNNIYGLMDEEAREQLSDLKSAFKNVNNINNQLENAEKNVFDNYPIVLIFERGRFIATGYDNAAKIIRSQILSAGKYTISAPTGYEFSIYTYNSNDSGTMVLNYRASLSNYTFNESFIINVKKTTYPSGDEFTGDEIIRVSTEFTIMKVGSRVFPTIQEMNDGIGNLEENIDNEMSFIQNEQNDISDDLYGSHPLYTQYEIGRFATNGYDLTIKSYAFSKEKLSAGTYLFPAPPTGMDYSVLKYINNNEGETFIAYRDNSIQETIPDNCIVSIRKTNGQNYTESEIETVEASFVVKKIKSASGALDEMEDIADKVNDWESEIFGEDDPEIELDLTKGYYLSGGFGGKSSDVRWRTVNALPAGTYKIENTDDNYVFYWVDFDSNTHGNVIFNSRSDDVVWMDTNENGFYLTFARLDTANITAEEIKARFTVHKIETSDSIEANVNRLYSTQKVVFMGDSIFGMERSNTSIPALCGYYTGAITYNCAIGGTAALEHPNDYKYYDLGYLTDAVIAWGNGDTHAFDNQSAHQSDTGNPAYIPNVITTLKSLDFTKINVLAISIGSNDWAMTLGTNQEIVDAIIATINKMLTAYPNLRIVLMGPPYKVNLDNQGQFVSDSDTWVNNNGVTLKSLAQKYVEIKEGCHIIVIDAMNENGIGRYNRSQWFISGDGSHPNETGRRETAKLVSEYLKRYLYD